MNGPDWRSAPGPGDLWTRDPYAPTETEHESLTYFVDEDVDEDELPMPDPKRCGGLRHIPVVNAAGLVRCHDCGMLLEGWA